jgi:hypothetical protein
MQLTNTGVSSKIGGLMAAIHGAQRASLSREIAVGFRPLRARRSRKRRSVSVAGN